MQYKNVLIVSDRNSDDIISKVKGKIFSVLILIEAEHLEAAYVQEFKTCELLITNKLLSISDEIFN